MSCRTPVLMLGLAALSLLVVSPSAANPPDFLLTWGSFGFGDGDFSFPYGIAVDPAGDLYVADTSLDAYFPSSLGDTSIPDMTLPLAHATPWLAAGVASTLIGLSWVIGRRNRIADEREAAESPEGEG